MKALLLSSFAARLHVSATLYALLIVSEEEYDSFAVAGLVTGCLVLGQGVMAPLRGRWVDRRPVVRPLIAGSTIYGVAIVALASATTWLPWWQLAPLATLAGLALPPATQASRARLAQLLEGQEDLAGRAFIVQSTGNELVLVIGPAAVSLAIATTSPLTALFASGALATAGGCVLAWAIWRAGVDNPSTTKPDMAQSNRILSGGAARAIVATITMVIAFAATEFVVLAWAAEYRGAETGGMLVAAWAAGSVVGGSLCTVSRRTFPVPSAVLATVIGLGVIVPALGTSNLLWITVALAIGGMPIPAAVGGLYQQVSMAAAERKGEAFGWIAVGTTAGIAVMNPLTGLTVDHIGVVLSSVIPVLLAIASLALIRWGSP